VEKPTLSSVITELAKVDREVKLTVKDYAYLAVEYGSARSSIDIKLLR